MLFSTRSLGFKGSFTEELHVRSISGGRALVQASSISTGDRGPMEDKFHVLRVGKRQARTMVVVTGSSSVSPPEYLNYEAFR